MTNKEATEILTNKKHWTLEEYNEASEIINEQYKVLKILSKLFDTKNKTNKTIFHLRDEYLELDSYINLTVEESKILQNFLNK